MILSLAIFAGLGMAVLLFKILFEDLAGFLECVRYWLTPDIVSMFRGERAELKLFLYLAVSGGIGVLTYIGLHKLLG